MSRNQTFGEHWETDSRNGFADFERLPERIRRVIDLAPYKYCVGHILKQWRDARAEGESVEQFRAWLIAAMAKRIQLQVAKDWSPDHPDALRSRLRAARQVSERRA